MSVSTLTDLRRKIDPETAVSVSMEIYMELKSMTIDRVEQKQSKSNPQMDWQQVVLNDGPPCFAQLEDEDGYYCGRAQRWEGHDGEHKFVALDDLLTAVRQEARAAALRVWRSSAEEMPEHEEIIAIHKGCISIGNKRELRLVNFIDAWCTRKDLVAAALEAAANSVKNDDSDQAQKQ